MANMAGFLAFLAQLAIPFSPLILAGLAIFLARRAGWETAERPLLLTIGGVSAVVWVVLALRSGRDDIGYPFELIFLSIFFVSLAWVLFLGLR